MNTQHTRLLDCARICEVAAAFVARRPDYLASRLMGCGKDCGKCAAKCEHNKNTHKA